MHVFPLSSDFNVFGAVRYAEACDRYGQQTTDRCADHAKHAASGHEPSTCDGCHVISRYVRLALVVDVWRLVDKKRMDLYLISFPIGRFVVVKKCCVAAVALIESDQQSKTLYVITPFYAAISESVRVRTSPPGS